MKIRPFDRKLIPSVRFFVCLILQLEDETCSPLSRTALSKFLDFERRLLLLFNYVILNLCQSAIFSIFIKTFKFFFPFGSLFSFCSSVLVRPYDNYFRFSFRKGIFPWIHKKSLKYCEVTP